jgi:hypothetical protein
MAQLSFNATGIQPATVAKPQLPVSDKLGHLMMIVASDIVENKSKTGGYVELELSIIEGQYKGESGLYRINLFNPSEVAVRIAEGQMAALCLVTGVIDVKDTQQLHNIPFRGVVGYQKGEDPKVNPEANGYTEVKGVLHADGAAPGKSAAGPGQQAPPQTPPSMPPQAPASQQQQTAPPAGQQWGGQPPAPEAPPAAPPWGGGGQPATAPPWASR